MGRLARSLRNVLTNRSLSLFSQAVVCGRAGRCSVGISTGKINVAQTISGLGNLYHEWASPAHPSVRLLQ
jgi:hypothetical protein